MFAALRGSATRVRVIGVFAMMWAVAGVTRGRVARAQEEFDPPEVTIGERLFIETRFAQYFKQFIDAGGTINGVLPVGDPAVDVTVTTAAPLSGPFAGQSMNCRSCHMVDEHVGTPGGGMRTYTDFARRSPIPGREDGALVSPRNSPPLVNASLDRPEGLLLHFDGEFTTLEDLVKGTFTGRNLGWLPRQSNEAVAHIARVIREDDGQGDLAQEFGGISYATLLEGTDPSIPAEFRLPKPFRLNVAKATDAEILDAVGRLVAAYTQQLAFSQDGKGQFNLSPYDIFLEANGLPRAPDKNENAREYSRRLLKLVSQLETDGALQFVSSNPNTSSGGFEFHDQPFTFGPQELEGLKIFFAEPVHAPLSQQEIAAGGVGNCIACHQAPTFTDFRIHNTGTTQVEYDGIHGSGAFASLAIPTLAQRQANPNAFLPATAQHPDATGRFRAVPSLQDSRLTDLGVWNVFANPDMPKPQARLYNLLCDDAHAPGSGSDGNCSPASLLANSVARFKTPGLRDLSHSAPYMHNGQFDTLADIIAFYRETSGLTRDGRLRNGARELASMALKPGDVNALVAFLRALNEDYQ